MLWKTTIEIGLCRQHTMTSTIQFLIVLHFFSVQTRVPNFIRENVPPATTISVCVYISVYIIYNNNKKYNVSVHVYTVTFFCLLIHFSLSFVWLPSLTIYALSSTNILAPSLSLCAALLHWNNEIVIAQDNNGRSYYSRRTFYVHTRKKCYKRKMIDRFVLE